LKVILKIGIITLFVSPLLQQQLQLMKIPIQIVKMDIVNFLRKLIPHDYNFAHIEGNSDAHIKSSFNWKFPYIDG